MNAGLTSCIMACCFFSLFSQHAWSGCSVLFSCVCTSALLVTNYHYVLLFLSAIDVQYTNVTVIFGERKTTLPCFKSNQINLYYSSIYKASKWKFSFERSMLIVHLAFLLETFVIRVPILQYNFILFFKSLDTSKCTIVGENQKSPMRGKLLVGQVCGHFTTGKCVQSFGQMDNPHLLDLGQWYTPKCRPNKLRENVCSCCITICLFSGFL